MAFSFLGRTTKIANASTPSELDTSELPWKKVLKRQLDVWRADPDWVDEPPKIDGSLVAVEAVGKRMKLEDWSHGESNHMSVATYGLGAQCCLRQSCDVSKVSVPKDAFIHMESEFVLALPPDEAFSILCDPGNRRVFKNIKGVLYRKVLETDGQREVVELEQLAAWRFLFLSGTFSVSLRVVEDRENRTMSFNLAKPGFMKHFQGQWKLEPLPVPPSHLATVASPAVPELTATAGSTVSSEAWGLLHSSWPNFRTQTAAAFQRSASETSSLEGPSVPWYGPGTRIATRARIVQQVSPALLPPPWLAHYLRGISANTTLEVLRDFQTEAARLRYSLPTDTDMKRELKKITQEREAGRQGFVKDGHLKDMRRRSRRRSRRVDKRLKQTAS